MALNKGILFLTLVVVALARKAPHADYIQQRLKTHPLSRYSSNIEEDILLDATGLVQKYGYPQETHTVTTSDGYILEFHRIPHGRDNYNTPGPRPVVFVMHGLLSSSADFIVLGPGNALAYTLAEAGYDVWLGNARGNYYSRNHVSLNPDANNQNFWRFSWDEIGNHDLPAMIDYVLAYTGQEKLHYVGHSQGGTSFLVLNSLRPEYSSKFISFQGLAPASFMNNNEVELFKSLAPLEGLLEIAAFAMGLGEVLDSYEFIDNFAENYCAADSIFSSICNSANAGDGLGSGGLASDYVNATMIPLFMAHAPAGSSIRQITHYAQVLDSKSFRRYNHNLITNLAVYGRTTPPDYNLSRVDVPTYIYYGLGDNEVNFRDIHLLASKLPRVEQLIQLSRECFNHYDFIWASDAKTILYDNVVTNLKIADGK